MIADPVQNNWMALEKCGLKLNVMKSATTRLNVHGKRPKWVCNPSGFLRGKDRVVMKAMSITDSYKYLDNTVSPADTIGSTVRDLQREVEELVRAPLKPQQHSAEQLATQSVSYSSAGLLAQEIAEVPWSDYPSHSTIIAPSTKGYALWLLPCWLQGRRSRHTSSQTDHPIDED